MIRLLARSGLADAPTRAILLVSVKRRVISWSVSNGMVRLPFCSCNSLLVIQPCRELFGNIMESLTLKTIATGRRRPAITGFADFDVERHAAHKGHTHALGRRFRSANAKRIADLAAMRTDIACHIFDHADDRDFRLFKQVHRPHGIHQGKVLGCCNDKRAYWYFVLYY